VSLGIELEWGAAWGHKLTDYPSAEEAYLAYVDRKRKKGKKPFLDLGHFNLTFDEFPTTFPTEFRYYKPENAEVVKQQATEQKSEVQKQQQIDYFLENVQTGELIPMQGAAPSYAPNYVKFTAERNIAVYVFTDTSSNLEKTVDKTKVLPLENEQKRTKPSKIETAAENTGIYGLLTAGLGTLVGQIFGIPGFENMDIEQSGVLTAAGVGAALLRTWVRGKILK
jgi:hypothetical protein